MSHKPNQLEWRRYLSGVLAANPFWIDFADAITEVNGVHVVGPRRQLQNIRNPDDLERLYLAANLKQIGFDYKSDLFSDDDYRRLLKQYSTYLPENGTKHFVEFLGFLKNTRFQIEQLWTKDYKEFIETYAVPPDQTIIRDSRGFYPSSHVRLFYDAEHFPILDFSDMYPLFYKVAPIHLVLEKVVGSVYSPPEDLMLRGAGYVHADLSGVCDVMPDPVGRVENWALAVTGDIVLHESGVADAMDTHGIVYDSGYGAAGHIIVCVFGKAFVTEADLPNVPPVGAEDSHAQTILSGTDDLTANMIVGII